MVTAAHVTVILSFQYCMIWIHAAIDSSILKKQPAIYRSIVIMVYKAAEHFLKARRAHKQTPVWLTSPASIHAKLQSLLFICMLLHIRTINQVFRDSSLRNADWMKNGIWHYRHKWQIVFWWLLTLTESRPTINATTSLNIWKESARSAKEFAICPTTISTRKNPRVIQIMQVILHVFVPSQPMIFLLEMLQKK